MTLHFKMLSVVLFRDHELKNKERGTCAVCFDPIVDSVYWRCPGSVGGGVNGSGRVCSACYVKVVDKSRCVHCNELLKNNPITDPALLEYAVNVEPADEQSRPFLAASVRGLSQTHLDEVIEFSRRNAAVMSFLLDCAICEWHLYPLDAIKKLYQYLESTIMHYWNEYPTLHVGTQAMIFDAVKEHPAWLLDTARWIIEWRNERKCTAMLHYSVTDYQSRLAFEARLLDMCETREEFAVLRDLALNEDRYDYLHIDVILHDCYLQTEHPGRDWVMHHLLELFGDTKQWKEHAGQLPIKFDYEPMYAWLGSRNTVVLHAPPNVELARKYHLVPLFYGCHRRGVYAVTGEKRIHAIPFKQEKNADITMEVVDKSAIYIDLSNEDRRDDWPSVPDTDIKTVDAQLGTLVVEFCRDSESVNLHIGDVQLLMRNIQGLKVVNFQNLRVRHVQNGKRKFHWIE